jgi:hypothetical protein
MDHILTYQDKNKLKTSGYFIKRLKDSGIITLRIFQKYGISDPRKWTILVDPGVTSVFITCYQNKEKLNEIMFEIDDGGVRFPRNYFIKTHSIEVIVEYLLEKGISQNDTSNPFYKQD